MTLQQSLSDTTPPLWSRIDAVHDALRDASGVLLGTDFDGTLSPIEDSPDEPTITPANRASLLRLREHPQVAVAVISGRGVLDVKERVGIGDITYSGNHGLELVRNGDRLVHQDAEAVQPTIRTICERLSTRFAGVDGCLVENKGVTATIHYRAVADDVAPDIGAAVQSTVDDHAPDRVETAPGKQSIEIRPSVPWNKGRIARLLADERDGDWLPIYLGDDTTDESVFREFTDDGVCIHVGDDETAADYRIRNPTDAEVFFRWLVTTGLEAVGPSYDPDQDRLQRPPAPHGTATDNTED
ncbi:trehalose-phosphatase [Haloferacaceae archaeon DSL9]